MDLQYFKVTVKWFDYTSVHAKSLQSRLTLQPHGLYSARLLYPWDSPGQNTGVGWCALLPGIFPIQGSNLHFLCLPALACGFFTTSTNWEALSYTYVCVCVYVCMYTYMRNPGHREFKLVAKSHTPRNGRSGIQSQFFWLQNLCFWLHSCLSDKARGDQGASDS